MKLVCQSIKLDVVAQVSDIDVLSFWTWFSHNTSPFQYSNELFFTKYLFHIFHIYHFRVMSLSIILGLARVLVKQYKMLLIPWMVIYLFQELSITVVCLPYLAIVSVICYIIAFASGPGVFKSNILKYFISMNSFMIDIK